MTFTAKLATWFAGNDTGLSSMAIAAYMAGADMSKVETYHAPVDPSDLGRCLRLLEIFPEWKPRIKEMAAVDSAWINAVAHWDEAAQTMEDEVGIDWSKGREAPITYHFMKSKNF